VTRYRDVSSSTGPSTAAGPSAARSHDEAWLLAHPKQNGAENAWCKASQGDF